MLDAFLTNCRLADGRLVDVGIAGGKIAVVGERHSWRPRDQRSITTGWVTRDLYDGLADYADGVGRPRHDLYRLEWRRL